MDRDEALRLLSGGTAGVAEWNQNRMRAPAEETPDLSEANLSGADLTKAILLWANLSGANLSGATLHGAQLAGSVLTGTDFSGADLTRANLYEANLGGANLSGAFLWWADCRGSDLRGANLSGADLSAANFSDANLTGAQLAGAKLGAANFSGANFSELNFGLMDLCEIDLYKVAGQVVMHDLDVPPGLGKTTLGSASLSWAPRPNAAAVVPNPPLGDRPPHLLRAIREGLRDSLRLRGLTSPSSCRQDLVDCSVFAPQEVMRGTPLIVQVFAHRPDQTKKVRNLAKEHDEHAVRRGFKSLEMEVEHGTKLEVHLHVSGLSCDNSVKTIVWQGQPTYVAFLAQVSPRLRPGPVSGNVTLSASGIPLGSIIFSVNIVAKGSSHQDQSEMQPVGETARAYKRAFISYASQDRQEVLKRIQMLRLARIQYFQDVLRLEPGDRWKQKLYVEIDKSDVFLLFWSRNAKRSTWVMKEIRYALERKGGNEFAPPDLIPVIIDGPPVPKPPKA